MVEVKGKRFIQLRGRIIQWLDERSYLGFKYFWEIIKSQLLKLS